MGTPRKNALGEKISKWQNNFMNRHPAFFYITMEFIAELLIATALAIFAFNMLPPDLSFTVSKKSPQASVLSIKNGGLIFAGGEYGIKSKSPIKKDPEVLAGKKYVDLIERRSGSAFGLRVSDMPFAGKVRVEFKSNKITVEEE